MAFWENFSETITAKSKEMADKAKNFTDIASLKGQIVSQENTILRYYKEIGREYYAAHKMDDAPEFPSQLEAIKSAERSIEELQKKIAELSGTKHCEACGSDVSDDSVFCPKCGAKLEEDTFFDEEDTEEVVVTEIVKEEDAEDAAVTEIVKEEDVQEAVATEIVKEEASATEAANEAVTEESVNEANTKESVSEGAEGV